MQISLSDCSEFLNSSHKTFHFTDESDIIELSCSSSDSLCSETDQHVCNQSCLNVRIKEALDASFGMYVWPCAPVLGKYIWYNRIKLKNKVVLELGAGTGLASVVAAKCSAHVIITDSDKYNPVFEIAKQNMILNNINQESFEIMSLDWGNFSPTIINFSLIDIIIGSDVFYDPHDFEDLLVTVSYILKQNPDAEFWCAYEHRCSDWSIKYLLQKWELLCKEVPLENFGADKFNVAGSDLPGLKTIRMPEKLKNRFCISESIQEEAL